AAGPSIGGALLSFFGWPSIFYAVAILAFVTAALSQMFVMVGTNTASREKGGIDFLGVLALVFTLGSFAGALTIGANNFGQYGAFALAASALGLVLFLLIETRATKPLLPLTIFQNAGLSTGLVLNVVVAMVMMATLVVPPFYLSTGLGLAAVQVGLVMAVGPVVSAITGFFAGQLTDRFGSSRIQLVGILEMTIGAIGLALLPETLGVVGYLVALAILTPGYQLFQAANNTKTMSKTTSANRGAISGLLNLSRNLGLITGATLMGTLFAIAVGMPSAGAATAEAMAHGMQVTFLTAAGLLGFATAVIATSQSTS
ncbi:MAG: MFS transporter, partial [Aestuariivirga sp.]